MSRAGFTSYADAEDGLTLLRADTLRGVPQVVSRDTFSAYGRRWFEGHPVSNGTRLYIQRVLDAMDPYIGSVRMADIRPTDLAAAYRGVEGGDRVGAGVLAVDDGDCLAARRTGRSWTGGLST